LAEHALSTHDGRPRWFERLFGRGEPTSPEAGSGSFQQIGPYYDQLMGSVPYRAWVDYVEELLRRFDARPVWVLDLACGTGKVGAELVSRGYRAVGVDLSEGMVRVAVRERRLPAAVQDARSLGLREAAFDLVVSLYDSLNYILQPEGLRSAFAGVRRALAPGGLFIFDLNTVRALALDYFTQDNLKSDEPLLYSWQSYWNPDTRICTVDMWFKWRGDGDEQEFREVHRQRGYEDEEVRELLRMAGLRVRAAYDAYSFEPLSRISTRAFYVAQR
jgi:SAM-dependent methyltransferase